MALTPVNPVDKHNNEIIQNYDAILRDMKDQSWFIFMNHGYAPCNAQLSEDEQKWQHQISLYNNLVLQAQKVGMSQQMQQMSILEIGSGRGGGLAFINRHYQPKQAIGLDLNINQVNFCNKTHVTPQTQGLSYQQGDSCALAFANQSFDAILNVESSHCYSNIYRFYHEVSRTLKPGGFFLYTDVFHPDDPLYLQFLALNSNELPGMEILYAFDMTDNVVEACAIDKVTFKSLFPDEKHAFISELSAEKEALYRTGKLKYLSVIARKAS